MDFDERIDAALEDADGDYVPGVLAEKLVAHTLEHEPETLREWLDAHAAVLVVSQIRHRLASARWLSINRARARAFKAAVDSGGPEDLGHFTNTYVIDENHTRRHVADMTGPDHEFVAEAYHRSGTTDLMLEAFHRAIAKKVGKKRTAEVMAEEEYDRQLRSILGARDE